MLNYDVKELVSSRDAESYDTGESSSSGIQHTQLRQYIITIFLIKQKRFIARVLSSLPKFRATLYSTHDPYMNSELHSS